MYLSAVLLSILAVHSLARPSHLHDDRSRALSSWSSWMPGSGMSMFSSADDPWGMQTPPVWRMGDDGHPRPVDTQGPTKKSSKRKGHDQEDEEEDDDSSERGSSRANASFNAWFPIVLGMYPGQEGSDSNARARPSSSSPGNDREGVAAIANSVNHGKSGVASSHAIVYSGEAPVDYRRKAQQEPQEPQAQRFYQRQPQQRKYQSPPERYYR